MAELTIRAFTADDWPSIRRIHEAGVATGNGTFDQAVPEWDRFDRDRLPGHRWLAERDGTTLGWVTVAAASTWTGYSGVVLSSVYVDPSATRQGVGAALYGRLFESTDADGIWTVEARVFAENDASLALHRKAGFREVGVRERMGRQNWGPYEGWRDVVIFERRSAIAGID